MESDSFSSLNRVKALFLNDNELKTIGEGALNGLVNLRMLNLRHNPFKSIDKAHFANLVNLKFLDVRDSELEAHIGHDAFTNCRHKVNVSTNIVVKRQPQAVNRQPQIADFLGGIIPAGIIYGGGFATKRVGGGFGFMSKSTGGWAMKRVAGWHPNDDDDDEDDYDDEDDDDYDDEDEDDEDEDEEPAPARFRHIGFAKKGSAGIQLGNLRFFCQ